MVKIDGHDLTTGDVFEWPAPGEHGDLDNGTWVVKSITPVAFTIKSERRRAMKGIRYYIGLIVLLASGVRINVYGDTMVIFHRQYTPKWIIESVRTASHKIDPTVRVIALPWGIQKHI